MSNSQGYAKPRKGTAGVTSVSSLESRLQDLGLSHVVGGGGVPRGQPGRPQGGSGGSRPGSSSGLRQGGPKAPSRIIDDGEARNFGYNYGESAQLHEPSRGQGHYKDPVNVSYEGAHRPGSSSGQRRAPQDGGRPRSPLHVDPGHRPKSPLHNDAVRPKAPLYMAEAARPRSPLSNNMRADPREAHQSYASDPYMDGMGPMASPMRGAAMDGMGPMRGGSLDGTEQMMAEYGDMQGLQYPNNMRMPYGQYTPHMGGYVGGMRGMGMNMGGMGGMHPGMMMMQPQMPRMHYQFCPNCGFQLVDNPYMVPLMPMMRGGEQMYQNASLAAAIPAGDSDTSDSEEDEEDDDVPRAMLAVPAQQPLQPVQQEDHLQGEVPDDLSGAQAKVASAAILKEMEGRRVQRLLQPGGDVVGQGKGVRPLPKGLVEVQEPGAGGKHRRIGSVDHNIYSSAMPQKKAADEGEGDQDNGAAQGGPKVPSASARRPGVPPLPTKSGSAAPPKPPGLAPKKADISRLQVQLDSDQEADGERAGKAKENPQLIDVSDGADGAENRKEDGRPGPMPGLPPPAPAGNEPKAAGGALVPAGAANPKSASASLYQAAMPSPGHRRISSWADGGNLKHTDFILRKPYRDVTDVYDVHDEELGVGQFGVIRSCVNKSTGLLLACKTISKERIVCMEDADDVRKEVQLMQQLRGHPNIIDLHETFEDSKHVHLVMELCKGGELFDRIKLRGQYTERNAALVFQTLIEALLYCHSNGIVHRDIKPENILLMKRDDDSVIKVIDFGVAARFRQGEILTEFVGTPYYMAPEVLIGNYGPEADIWSAGIVLYIMLCGFPPFWANSNEGIFDAIQNNELQFKSSKWRNVSEPAKDLIRATLMKDPRERISALEILGHEWIVGHAKGKS